MTQSPEDFRPVELAVVDSRVLKNSKSASALAWLLTVFLALVPAPLGGNRPWAAAIVALSASVLLLLLAWNSVSVKRISSHWRALCLVGVPWLAAMSIAVAQLFLPFSCDSSFVSAAFDALRSAIPSLSPRSWTIDAEFTQYGLQLQSAYAATFLIAFTLGSYRRHARMLIAALAFAGGAYALFAIANHLLNQSTEILWYVQKLGPGEKAELRGTFVYRNAYALHASLAALCALSALLKTDRYYRPDRQQGVFLGWLLSSERTVYLLCFLLASIATFASSSRGGSAALVAGIATLLVLRSLVFGQRRSAVILLALLAALGTAAVFFTGLGERLLQLSHGTVSRIELWQTALYSVSQCPWGGYGLGTYRRIVPLLQTASDPFAAFQAHSTVLETAADLGWPGFALLMLPFLLMLFRFMRAINRQTSAAHYAILGIGVSAMAFLHACFDFTLQMPANAIWFVAICGVCFARCQEAEGTNR